MPAPRSQRVTCERLTPSRSASRAAERKSTLSVFTFWARATGMPHYSATECVAQHSSVAHDQMTRTAPDAANVVSRVRNGGHSARAFLCCRDDERVKRIPRESQIVGDRIDLSRSSGRPR